MSGDAIRIADRSERHARAGIAALCLLPAWDLSTIVIPGSNARQRHVARRIYLGDTQVTGEWLLVK
jgi:hypothetical protein